ncbi:unnamed protein product [Protopolystoma xenopodis]|uniref:Protein argonaute N-terminal domain-containing protein n=1 Tax=Protopolystoma xenopodis TaxID=117903 RepID=A0A3S4ZJJ5_9PLAT|nr:unnamed protein product [Protopolystoma xenopodis]
MPFTLSAFPFLYIFSTLGNTCITTIDHSSSALNEVEGDAPEACRLAATSPAPPSLSTSSATSISASSVPVAGIHATSDAGDVPLDPSQPPGDQNLPSEYSSPFEPPIRPNQGSEGRPIALRANHFEIRVPKGYLHHYDVSITPDKCPRRVNR